ncbi:hypothetical protein FB45DRAFT_891041 [Roridomyces roridus]|uniref:Uncharacterized protein n=1 Tax=Roridomyces roridus TaxID=1738132 RepID=A0AAD7FW68_9AGAR|nr:hypothetical protein FB45DRAFT_891041 [Roridomyces roridus]
MPSPACLQAVMTSSIPAEIYAIICSEVQGNGTLVTLCSTSRLLRDLAQHILYHSVDLTGCSLRTIKSWALSVSRNAHLAARVQSLAIEFPEDMLDPTDATKITLALNKCVNLKDLEVACARFPNHSNSKHVWMIEDCPFRLHTFRNSYFTTSDTWMTKFWEAQTEIRVLAFRWGGSVPTGYLPNLLAVRAPQVSGLPLERPLQRVYTTFDNDISQLARYSQSLKTVNLERTWSSRDSLTFLGIIEILADSLPLLRHLWLVERSKSFRGIGSDFERAPTTALQRMSHLEDVVLHTRSITFFKEGSDGPLYSMTQSSGLEAQASAIMAVCPTLQRVNLGGAAARDVELTCLLTRSTTGGIRTEHGTEFDSDAASMFWRIS